MALPPWTVELLRRGLGDVARRASEPETLQKLRTQASDLLNDLPQTAARSIDRVMHAAEMGKENVRRWSRKHTTLAVPLLNASGVLLTPFGSGVAVSEAALEAGYESLRGDVLTGDVIDGRIQRRLQRTLPEGDYDIAIASSFPAALSALSLIGSERDLVIHRSQAVRLAGGIPLPEAFGTLLPMVHEVGAVDRVERSDFDGLDSFCAILADGGQRPIEAHDLAAQDALQAAVLAVATLSKVKNTGVPSASEILSQGIDLVVMPGDGLAGGPECGLLIGRREMIQWITSSASWAALRASRPTQAMMCVALEAAMSPVDSQPIASLMTTSEENLRGRAERLATRISGTDTIASAKVAAEDAKITADGRWRLPSRQVVAKHRTKSAAEWAEELRNRIPSVLAKVEGESLSFDLRWLDPPGDSELAEAISGRPIPADPASPAPGSSQPESSPVNGPLAGEEAPPNEPSSADSPSTTSNPPTQA